MKLTTVRKLNKYISVTSILVVLTLLVSVSLMGFLGAKYVKEIPFSGNVTITANLANKFTLLESSVNMLDSGQYIIDNTKPKVESNSYFVLPGVDIPKDPEITIIGKTNVRAYLYLEVVNTLGSEIQFELNDAGRWKKLDGAVPKNLGATVYVYTTDGTNVMVFDGTEGDTTISLIKDNKLTVPSSTKLTSNLSLNFYASLLQVVDGQSAEQIYNGFTPTP